jgi:hypothetical protein
MQLFIAVLLISVFVVVALAAPKRRRFGPRGRLSRIYGEDDEPGDGAFDGGAFDGGGFDGGGGGGGGGDGGGD